MMLMVPSSVNMSVDRNQDQLALVRGFEISVRFLPGANHAGDPGTNCPVDGGLQPPRLAANRSCQPWQLVRACDAGRPAPAHSQFRPGQACIFIYLYGGPSHIDVWDLKPDAPAEIRGEFKPIPTSVSGIQLCEHLPRLARLADRLAIVRSLTHGDQGHGSAGHLMLTGQAPRTRGEIAPTGDDHPHYGTVLGQQFPGTVPPCVALPWRITTQINVIPGQTAGFLGKGRDPVLIQAADGKGNGFLLSAPGPLAQAVNLEKVPAAERERYGRNLFGHSMLLARRLVEAGARWVTVYWPDRKDEKALVYNGRHQPVSVPMWDTHGSHVGDTANFPSLRERLLAPLDLASAALLEDLGSAGRLHETLVVWAGEFGRTPRVQGDGRGHYGAVFSGMLAGGGIRGGQVYGASHATGAAVKADPVSPADFTATIYHCLGIAPELTLPTPQGQRVRVVTGRPVPTLIA